MDKARILSLLSQMESYLNDLIRLTPRQFKEYENNLEKKRFCERTVQLAIETCLDVSQLLVKELKLGLPAEEESVFEMLFKHKIISKEVTLKLKAMKRFRNFLIHRYVEIDDQLVYQNITKNLNDFQKFKKEIVQYLKKNKLK